MARRTFADFDTELDLSLGKRLSTTIRNFVIDSAYYYVANAIRHHELETTASPTLTLATDNVALASDFWFPELIFNDTDDQPINPGSVNYLEAKTKPAGNPSKYTQWGTSLYFDRKPTVNKTIKIFYTKRPAEPSSGESSVLDHVYDQLILMYSIKFAHEELRDYEQAAKMMLAIDAYTERMKIPWRMTKTEDRERRIAVRMR